MDDIGSRVISRLQWLILNAMEERPDGRFRDVQEAVSAEAAKHPEWDLTEKRTLREWDAAP